jgi:hypothetical protein
MRRGDRLAACQVGNRARQLEDAVEGASGELEPLRGGAQNRLGGVSVRETVLAAAAVIWKSPE